MWKGSLLIKIYTVITFVLMIISKMLNVTYPYFLKLAIDGISCVPSTSTTACATSSEVYLYIALYGGIKFSADFTN